MDFHNVEFSKFLNRLDPHPPITEALRAELTKKRGKPRHASERDHMADWFYSQISKGYGEYSRRRPNYSARVTYNRLLSVTGLIWISEALDIDPTRSEHAVDIALGPGRVTTKCRDIRKLFPWGEVAENVALSVDLGLTKKSLD